MALTELTTRKQHRPYLSDVVELSAQKVAIEAETGVAVLETGYVLTQVPDHSRRLHAREFAKPAAEGWRLDEDRTIEVDPSETFVPAAVKVSKGPPS